MAYDVSIRVISFQWKGEKTDELCEFAKQFEQVSFTQTKTQVLRAKYNNMIVEVPLGSFLIVPEGDLLNMFALGQRVFSLASRKADRDIEFELGLQNVRILFNQDYTETMLEKLLQRVDSTAFVESSKYRFFCSRRYVGLTNDRAVVLGTDFAFTWSNDFCSQLASVNKIRQRDKQVVVDDASIVIIRTDATVIVDSNYLCSIKREDTLDGADPTVSRVTGSTKEFEMQLDNSPWKFQINDNSGANTTVGGFIRENLDVIGVPLTKENLNCMLKYVFDTLNKLMKRASISQQNRMAADMRINKLKFQAVYCVSQRYVVLVVV